MNTKVVIVYDLKNYSQNKIFGERRLIDSNP